MIITVEIKTVYGKELIYPVCNKARIYAEIAKTKTLSRQDIKNIRELGYDVVQPIKELSC